MAYLGIDVGTGGTRALVMDSKGNVIASASAEHQHFASPKAGVGGAGSARLVAGLRDGGAEGAAERRSACGRYCVRRVLGADAWRGDARCSQMKWCVRR